MRKDIYKEGKKTRFSSTNQPPNESKRKPKWKTHLKRALLENIDAIDQAIIDRAKKGDIKAIEFIKNWLYGKDTEKVEHSVKTDTLKELKDIFDND